MASQKAVLIVWVMILNVIIVSFLILQNTFRPSLNHLTGSRLQQKLPQSPTRIRPIAGFYHVSMLTQWEKVVAEQLRALSESGLLDASDMLYVTILGDRKRWSSPPAVGVYDTRKIFLSFLPDLEAWEFPTLDKLWHYCNAQPDAYVYYIHSKGVNHDPTEGVAYRASIKWRRQMQHFVVARWRECVQRLDAGNISCGSFLKPGWPAHYSGNFWWTKCDYIRRYRAAGPPSTLNEVESWGRMFAEFWLLDADFVDAGGAHCCFEDNLDHYENDSFPLETLADLHC